MVTDGFYQHDLLQLQLSLFIERKLTAAMQK